MNNSFPSIDYVMSLTPMGMKEGRDNVIKLMKALGNPQDKLEVFHVTGSNGKGSVCQMLSQVLWKAFGKKVGLFTSPHFIRINERFQIDGIAIGDNQLEYYYKKVIDLSEKYDTPLSFFEIQVVVMVLYFSDQKVDYAVVEVGLGGTYDGTNIFTHPLACFITSITQEHTHVLGKSRNSILRNKLGILKRNTPLYTPLSNKLTRDTCKENNSTLHITQKTNKILTNLPGRHQQKNAQMVLESLRDLSFHESKIKQGLQKIYNPGRFEWISSTILVDTANNTQNVKILNKMIERLKIQKKITVIFGTTQVDPEYASELANMIPAEEKILVDDFCDRSLPCDTYKKKGGKNQIIHFLKEEEKIRMILQETDKIKIIYGSLYLVGEIMRVSRYIPFATH